ncbi:COG1470 family protein [Paenarthrobacter nitroguajacolicus]|uniref:COG1470 family protein n=1 Tax=Paenarthrobacter nitroguajacolicus TaxID=211146 RepID=UPI00248CD9CF|nr:hypothetical protein [Paenarthrobacter nitroguajacolicus]MDI2037315.1 hypothetical protein [Paenarthrobacter nitroguajacolicus]
MDHRPERTASFHRRGVARALMLVLMMAVLPIAALAASNGQASGQGNAAKAPVGITVTLSPSSRTVDQGQSTTFTVSATSTGGFTGPVTFTTTGLPAGASASIAPSSVSLTSGGTAQATLTVGTATTTPVAKTDFTVKAGNGTIVSNAAPGQLQVLEVKRNFGVTGSVNGLLAPGVSRSVELQISNSGNKGIAVTNLSVAISQVVRTPAAIAANLPCSAADYKLTQYAGAYPLTVEPGVRTLSALGVPESGWPRITMYDTPQLQDGCKGATIQLTYSGTGQGN